MNKVISVVLGGQIGSEGKGKIAGYLALRDNYNFSINNFYPNAGHTWVGEDRQVKVHHLPIALVNNTTNLLIGPAAAISVSGLLEEMNKYEESYQVSHRLRIHPRAVIVEDKHKEMEKNSTDLNMISSTLTGGGAASAEKILRRTDVKLCRDVPELRQYLSDTEVILHKAISEGKGILIEAAQGFELDINYGYEYPFTTSRQTTTGQLIADCGVPFEAINKIYCVLRTYPIRVGNSKDGTSGGWGKEELSWEIIQKRAGLPENYFDDIEYTTTTHKKRRVFEFDFDRLEYMININQPTDLCVNHVDYLNAKDTGVTQYELLSTETKKFIKKVEDYSGIKVTLIGTGGKNNHIVDRS